MVLDSVTAEQARLWGVSLTSQCDQTNRIPTGAKTPSTTVLARSHDFLSILARSQIRIVTRAFSKKSLSIGAAGAAIGTFSRKLTVRTCPSVRFIPFTPVLALPR